MSDEPNKIRELSWRGELTPAQEAELRAWLAANPRAQADWENERTLNKALNLLPDVPVPSNFTARVLQAVEREAAAGARVSRFRWRVWHWRLRWLPKAALALVVLAGGLFTYGQVQAARRAEIARSVAAISQVAIVPNHEVLQDFEAVWALEQSPPADEALLDLFK